MAVRKRGLSAVDVGINRQTSVTLHAAIDRATPDQRLTLLTLMEQPRLFEAMDSMISELSEGLR